MPTKSRDSEITRDKSELYLGLWWSCLNITDRGVFRIETFSGLTAREAEQKALRRLNELLESGNGYRSRDESEFKLKEIGL